MSAKVKDKNYHKNCKLAFPSQQQFVSARILFCGEIDFTRKKCYVNFSACGCVTKINRQCRYMLGFAHFLNKYWGDLTIIIDEQYGSFCKGKVSFKCERRMIFYSLRRKMCAKVKALCGLLLAYVSAADQCLCPTCMFSKFCFL